MALVGGLARKPCTRARSRCASADGKADAVRTSVRRRGLRRPLSKLDPPAGSARDPRRQAVGNELGRGADLALPDNGDPPPGLNECRFGLCVPLLVAGKLRPPVLEPRLRTSPGAAESVAVPEAAVDEHGAVPTPEHEVRPPWQASLVQAVAQAPGEQKPPQRHLGLGVPAPDAGHHPRALLRSDCVHELDPACSVQAVPRTPETGALLHLRSFANRRFPGACQWTRHEEPLFFEAAFCGNPILAARWLTSSLGRQIAAGGGHELSSLPEQKCDRSDFPGADRGPAAARRIGTPPQDAPPSFRRGPLAAWARKRLQAVSIRWRTWFSALVAAVS